MKKLLLLFLITTLLLSASCNVCLSETQIAKAPKKFLHFKTADEEEIIRDTISYLSVPQSVYVPVTIITHNADGTTTQTYVTPQVLTIDYSYQVTFSDEAGVYTGGNVPLNASNPSLTVNDQSSMGLRVSCAIGSYPVIAYIETHGTTYTVHVRGGSFSITYDAVIHKNQYDVITSRESTTVMRGYYLAAVRP